MPDHEEDALVLKQGGWSRGTKILVGIVLVIFIVALAAVFTLTIAVMGTGAGAEFPYLTSYRVSLPDGEPVMIGNIRIVVLSIENEVVTDVDGTKEKLMVGQQRVISPHKARITMLGMPILDADFQITLTYLGQSGNNALFDMTVKTSQQVPEIILRRLIPSNMNAQPA